MSSATQPAATPKWKFVLGWTITILLALMMLAGGAAKLVMPLVMPPEQTAKGVEHIGWHPSTMLGLAILEITCAVLYLIPRSSVLGAILLTGYLGGAVATHVRIGEAAFIQVFLGVLVWAGLYLRDERLRALLPLRNDSGPVSLLSKIGIALLAVVFTLVIAVILQPDEFRIVRTATINGSPTDVFAQVNDFHNWKAWSPWAKMDSNTKETYEGPSAGQGAIFKWSSDKTGEGQMTLLESRPGEFIRIKLEFIKPEPWTGTTRSSLSSRKGSKPKLPGT